MFEKGAIKYPERYKQLISYEGMVRDRGITPTDIDTFIDYNGVAFIYGDAKLKGAELSYGQKLAYQHLVFSHTSAGNECIVFIYEHNEPPDKIIMAKNCPVILIFWNKKWHEGVGLTLLQHIEKFEKYCKEKGIKI